MQISAPGCFNRPPRQATEKGFTLIELMVVMIIISIGIAVAVIALRPDHRGAVRQEGERLAALLGMASEESGVRGTPLAWIGNEGGYEFAERELTDQGPDWTVISGDDLLHPRQLPTGTYIRSIEVDGKLLEFGQRVPLGNQSTHELAVEIALDEARVTVTGRAGHFQAALTPGGGA
jgi:type II secretion system protein H